MTRVQRLKRQGPGLDIVGVTGSIPVAPTIRSSLNASYRFLYPRAAPSRPEADRKHPARGGLFPCVKAYVGPLPAGVRGIEFTTPVAPDARSSMPTQVRWYHPHTAGVQLRKGNPADFAVISANVTNRQP